MFKNPLVTPIYTLCAFGLVIILLIFALSIPSNRDVSAGGSGPAVVETAAPNALTCALSGGCK